MKNIVKAIMSAALSGCMLMPFAALAAEPVSFTDEEIKLADSNRYRAVSYIGNSSLFMGDFDGNGELTASDARMLLRYTAGLEQKPGDDEFDYRCDMNADNRITPADARLVLRIVSKIDNSDITYLNAFNTILNAVKPDNQKVRAAYRSTVVSKDYDNKEISKKFKAEINKILDNILLKGFMKDEDKKELEKIDLGRELTSIDHNTEDTAISPIYRNNGVNINASNCTIKFPLGVESRIASKINLSQVSKIEYKDNDEGVVEFFSAFDSSKSLYGPIDVKCASITVYLKDETVVEVPKDKTLINHGKLFNIASIDNNTEFNGVDSDFSDYGKIDGKLDSVKYHGSYVKLYFNNNPSSPNYGKPVYVDYNLKYNINVYSHFVMDIDFNEQFAEQLKEIFGRDVDLNSFPDLYLNDYFVLTTGFNDRTEFYFEQNAN